MTDFRENFVHATNALSEKLTEARLAAEDAGGPSVDQLNGFTNVYGLLAVLEQLYALNKTLREHNSSLINLIELGNQRIEEAIHSQTQALTEALQG